MKFCHLVRNVECRCEDWVDLSCYEDGNAICQREQWRSCIPTECDQQTRTVVDTDCCDKDSEQLTGK